MLATGAEAVAAAATEVDVPGAAEEGPAAVAGGCGGARGGW